MRTIAAALLLVSALPACAQDVKGAILKHLKVSKEFTLKVAEAMPAESYDFKLTPPQMSFGGQITHLSQGLDFFLTLFQARNQAMPSRLRTRRPM